MVMVEVVGILENLLVSVTTIKNYLLLERVENGRSGRSLIEVKRWFLFIVLPENIEKIDKIYHNGITMAPIRPNG